MEENNFPQAATTQSADDIVFCGKCGAGLPRDIAYCTRCGAKHGTAPAKIPAKRPVASIVIMSIALIPVVFNAMLAQQFSLNEFLYLLIYSGMLVSYILYKKNVCYITAICWVLLTLLELWNLTPTLIYITQTLSSLPPSMGNRFVLLLLNLWYPVLMLACYILLAWAFFFFKTKAGKTLRIIGSVTGLILNTICILWIKDSAAAWVIFFTLAFGDCLFLSALLAKPQNT